MFVHSNRNNNIYVPELDSMIVMDVACLRVLNLLKIFTLNFSARNGYIDSPQSGWIITNTR